MKLASCITIAVLMFANQSYANEGTDAKKEILETLHSVSLLPKDISPQKYQEACRKPKTSISTYNIFIGINAGNNLTTGKCNILIGHYALLPTGDTDNFINIGNRLCFDGLTGKKLKCPKLKK